ncbi:MAG: universal stress protein [Micromonosporaceae bacterium]|jgi:nucleotide-binding universal stress UspA family protein
MTTGPILVGFDGSRDAWAALRWAQDEAARCGAPIRLVYVYEWSSAVTPVPAGSGWPDPEVRQAAVGAVSEAVERARQHRPDVEVDGTVIDGTVVSTMCKLSESARMVVVGSRGLGGFSGLLAGSVATGIATCARAPVVVTRGSARRDRPVVVGLDPEAPDCDGALSFAYDQAASRGVGLVALRAWRPPPVPCRTDTEPVRYDEAALEAAERGLVEGLLDRWRRRRPEVPVTVRLVADTPAHALVTASEQAQMVVVGCLGRGGGAGQSLGSVARQVIHHAHCPVAVIRGRE